MVSSRQSYAQWVLDGCLEIAGARPSLADARVDAPAHQCAERQPAPDEGLSAASAHTAPIWQVKLAASDQQALVQ